MTRFSWLELAAATDSGRTRSRNEDAVGWRRTGEFPGAPFILVVADGMGGHAAGNVASQIAVDTVLTAVDSRIDGDLGARLTAALVEANQRILSSAAESAERAGMGTTCVIAAWDRESVTIANIGDSRAYLLHGDRLSQLTEDHSWVQEQVRRHLIEADEARSHPMRNVITRALGVQDAVEPDIVHVVVQTGDTLLLCSDGLSGVLLDVEIQAILARDADVDTIAADLIAAANDAGGPDNITVIVARYVGAAAEPAQRAHVAPERAPGGPSTSHRISVVVTNWNGWSYLERCLTALGSQTRPADQILVVDNGSTDGSAAAVRARFPGVDVIALDHNLGFAAGSNRGFAAATGDLVVSLNNDTVPDRGWLAALECSYRRAVARGLQVGAVASVMVRPTLPAIVDSAGIDLDRAGLAWDRLGGLPISAVGADDRPVFGACGGAALYSRSMLQDLGGFAEDFFAYLDDVDLAWRARQRGWQAVLAAGARVQHVHSGSFGSASARKRRLLARNKVRLLVRNYPTEALLRNLPWVLLFDALALVGAVITPNREGSRAAVASFAGRAEGLLALPTLLRQRAQVQSQATVPFALIGLKPVASPLAAVLRYRYLWRLPQSPPVGAH